MVRPDHRIKIKVQLICGEAVALGPGKADLLSAISVAGSISGAARAMGMSYRRAWQMVDLMNRCWNEPLVETSPGRAQGGGARLTEAGIAVLDGYRRLQAALDGRASLAEFDRLSAQIRSRPLRSQSDRNAEASELFS